MFLLPDNYFVIMSTLSSEKISLNFKDIHIGHLIRQSVKESGLDDSRICSFMNCTMPAISQMYECKSLDSDVLLRWSKLLKYDFFRIYSQHLILYAPPSKVDQDVTEKQSVLPTFRKNIYTREIIDFILEEIHSGQLSVNDVTERYNIPKTTLYKWIKKYKS